MEELTPYADLPNPLQTRGGEPVTTPAAWVNQRRDELKELFQHFMYGYVPQPLQPTEAHVAFTEPNGFGGKATLSEVVLTFGPEPMPTLRLLVATPNAAAAPTAAFVGPNFHGNHTLVDSPDVALPGGWVPDWWEHQANNRAVESGRGQRAERFNFEAVIDRGYAVASFYHGDIAPDRPNDPDSVQACVGHDRGDHSWGALAAWAWGIQRAVDYLRTHPAIDSGRIASVGHSRNGKAALLAAAFDERIAMAIPCQAGCGGTAPSRSTAGESVKQINDQFPHWFCDAFKQFNDRPERLPFDQHCLIALMAPRPVLLPNAADDQWANPAGQFEMLQAADPVYRLLDAGGLDADACPELNRLIDSKLGYWIRPGAHAMGPDDWATFMDFADKWL